jgi:predicted amino acid dehydrogenase
MIAKNTWVRIHQIILPPGKRAETVPEDTRKVPLEMWDKGFLLKDADLGEEVQVRTASGRIVSGTLLEANPAFHHDFGDFVPEILKITEIVKTAMEEVKS